MHDVIFEYLGYPIVELSLYGELKDIDLVILCQHGFRGKDFIEYFEDFSPRFQTVISENDFDKYLDIEHDFGTLKLSKFIANKLEKIINVAVVVINCDRGIVDANREDEHCIRPLVKTYASEATLLSLVDVNSFIRSTVNSILDRKMKKDGCILDVHSMWPYTLSKNPDKCESFSEFVDLYQSLNWIKERRAINLIVHDANGIAIADTHIADLLDTSLRQAKYETRYDKPYYILPERSNYGYFKKFRGIALDIPRDLIGDPRENSFPDFSSMVESPEKLKSLSSAIYSGLSHLF